MYNCWNLYKKNVIRNHSLNIIRWSSTVRWDQIYHRALRFSLNVITPGRIDHLLLLKDWLLILNKSWLLSVRFVYPIIVTLGLVSAAELLPVQSIIVLLTVFQFTCLVVLKFCMLNFIFPIDCLFDFNDVNANLNIKHRTQERSDQWYSTIVYYMLLLLISTRDQSKLRFA